LFPIFRGTTLKGETTENSELIKILSQNSTGISRIEKQNVLNTLNFDGIISSENVYHSLNEMFNEVFILPMIRFRILLVDPCHFSQTHQKNSVFLRKN
jgi:hypothetical protein